MSQNNTKNDRISLLVTGILKRKLERLAKYNSMPLTAYMRQELEMLVNRKDGAKKALRTKQKSAAILENTDNSPL